MAASAHACSKKSIDLVSDYLVFHVVPERTIDDDSVANAFEHAVDGIHLDLAQPGAWSAVDPDGKSLAKVMRRPDGKWQVWGSWGQAAFDRVAKTTVALAEQLHERLGGEIAFLGRRMTSLLRDEIHARTSGLGVDFHEWTQQLPR